MVKIDRRQIARGQLDTAIDLHLNGGDPVSAHVLSSAATEILRGYAKYRGIVSFDVKAEQFIKPDKLGLWRNSVKRHYNFFKHCERDAHVNEIEFDSFATEFELISGIEDYALLFQQQTLPMTAFKAYFVKTYPESVTIEIPDPIKEALSQFDVLGDTPKLVAGRLVTFAKQGKFRLMDPKPPGLEL